MLDTWGGRVTVLSTLVLALAAVGTGTYALWGFATSPFDDGVTPAVQKGEVALHSSIPHMSLRSYLDTHPQLERDVFSGDELGASGVQVRVTIHVVGFAGREIGIRVSDPANDFIGAEAPFKPPADDFSGEVDHWAPYGFGVARAYIELRHDGNVLASVISGAFREPMYLIAPPEPPRDLLPPVLVGAR